MEIKAGEYFRNKYGIAKVIKIENNNGIDILIFDKPICYLVNKETGEVKDNLMNRLSLTDNINLNNVKHGKIIDCIEVGDYVNGYYVNEITDIDTGLPVLCNFDLNTMEWTQLENIDIWYSIVTKEQFEAMEYKVE